jgi:hypothetical protein
MPFKFGRWRLGRDANQRERIEWDAERLGRKAIARDNEGVSYKNGENGFVS